MKILYASDTHVYPAHLGRLLNAAAELLPGAVIIGGDIIPDWKGSIEDSIEPHRAWVRDKLLPRLNRFRDELPHIPVLLDLGNDDIAAARGLLEERDGVDLHLLHRRVVPLGDDLVVAGYMTVNPTPFLIKDNEKPDCRDHDGLGGPGVARRGFVTYSGTTSPHVLDTAGGAIEDDLDALSELLEEDWCKNRPFLFVSHAPPRDTCLDLTGTGLHVGSLAVRRFIEHWGPTGRLLASLHGHIHESPSRSGRALQRIAGVPCFNAGQTSRVLRGLSLDTADVARSAKLVQVDASGRIVLEGLDNEEGVDYR